MNPPVTVLLQRIFARATSAAATEKAVALRAGQERPRRPDFAETRPVIFRSEAFAEDLVPAAGAA